MQGHSILINSENRSSGSSSDFTYEIQGSNSDYTHCIVLGCNIPVSYYLVSPPNNTFVLTEGLTSVTIEVHAGNYNVNSWQDTITTLLNDSSPNNWTYTVSFFNDYTSQSNGLYTFHCTQGNPTISFPLNSEIYPRFGMLFNSSNTFVSNTLVSTNVVNFIAESVLRLSSNLVEDGDLLTIFSDNSAPYQNISYQCQTDLYAKRLANKAKDSTIKIRLLDKHGNVLDLNGQNILINLLIYKPDEMSANISNYIKYKLLTNQ